MFEVCDNEVRDRSQETDVRRTVLLTFCLCLVFMLVQPAKGEENVEPTPFKVTYLEFPPYYFTNSQGEPDGFLLKKADAIFRSAGLEPVYESQSAKHVLMQMRGLIPICSIGWFKTPKRELFAKFSKPMYQNEPLHVLYLKENEYRLMKMDSLRELLQDKSLTMGRVGGYSYGPVVDQLLKEYNPSVQTVAGEQPQLVRMLAAGHFSYMLAAPEEIETLISMNYLSSDLFKSKRLSDLPAGNKRYLMFSRGISDDVIVRINHAMGAGVE